MKKISIFLVIMILAACKQESPLTTNREAIKAQIRIVGIDSVSAARTEDKILFVNVK